jgi:hypothetical protein
MATDQKPPPFRFDPKNPQPPLDLQKIFNEERIDLKALMDSRKLTKEINKTLAPYTGEFGDAQKKHLLKRTMVGYASRHLKDLEGLTMDQAVDLIMTPHEFGEPVNNYYFELSAEEYKEKYGNEDVGPGEPFISRPYIENYEGTNQIERFGQERQRAIESWIYRSMLEQPTSISWKFYIFFHNLTPVNIESSHSHKAQFIYHRLMYNGAFRSYKDFIYDLTIDPAMLSYLNLRLSRKETPDENYAREVQELFTVGKRPFSKFTEEDVQSAARLLVGWDYDWSKTHQNEGTEVHTIFHEWNHDTGDKQFSEFYGNKIIRGKEGQAGREELNEFINMIFETDEVAIYLSRRLYQYFVYPILSDAVEETIILPLAEVMRSNNYNLSQTLSTLLKSEYFYAEELYDSMFKPPIDFSIGFHKEFDLINGDVGAWDHDQQREYLGRFPEDLSYFEEKFFDSEFRMNRIVNHIQWSSSQQGMQIMNPPSVSGWPAFYQEPVYDLFWLNSVTIKSKKQITDSVSRWGIYMDNNVNLRYDLKRLIESFNNPEDINAFVEELTNRFFGAPIPEKALDRIKKIVLGDQLDERYWTEAVNQFKANQSRQNYNTLYHKIQEFMFLAFQLNEIHVH